MWSTKVKPIGASAVFSTDLNGDLNKVINALNLIESQSSAISPFESVFASNNKNNAEIIFCIRYSLNEATNGFSQYLYPYATGLQGYTDVNGVPFTDYDPLNATNGALRYEYKWSFFESLSPNDTRKQTTFMDFYKDPIKGISMKKFLGELEGDIRQYTSDWPIYRHMDIVLMLAEVYNELGNEVQVKKYIDQVRQRAYGDSFPTFTYTTKADAEEAILRERAIEFVAEGKYWYDVRRMKGGADALLQVENNEQRLLWPVDASVLSRDPLVNQTPGY